MKMQHEETMIGGGSSNMEQDHGTICQGGEGGCIDPTIVSSTEFA